MEFQAIVLAGGKGSRMTDLTSNTPKCLLPIGTKPMIWYPVRMLEKAGFNEINIITLESIKSRVEAELKMNHGIRANLNMFGIDDSKNGGVGGVGGVGGGGGAGDDDEGDEDNHNNNDDNDDDEDDELGTANSLKIMKDKLSKDCMIVSCDLIANVNIQSMANFYRVNNASFVALLADVVEQSFDLPVPGSKGKYSPERDIVALDCETNRILYFNSQDDVEEIKLKYRVFQKYPKLIWTSKLQDAHFYIIKKCLVDYIIDNNNIFSIKSDFLPFICKKQFSSSHKKSANQQRPTVFDYIRKESENLTTHHHSHHSKKSSEDLLSCYAFILADGFSYRANNLAIFAEANRQVLAKIAHYYQRDKTEIVGKSQVGSDNIIDEGTVIGEKCVIKRSVIGKNCKIADKSKITNSILMDNVVLEEGAVVQGSVVCSNSKISAKSELKDCLVGYNQDVITTGKYSNETIIDVDNWIDE